MVFLPERSILKVLAIGKVTVIIIPDMAFENGIDDVIGIHSTEFFQDFFQGLPAVAVFSVGIGIVSRPLSVTQEIGEPLGIKIPVDPVMDVLSPVAQEGFGLVGMLTDVHASCWGHSARRVNAGHKGVSFQLFGG